MMLMIFLALEILGSNQSAHFFSNELNLTDRVEMLMINIAGFL